MRRKALWLLLPIVLGLGTVSFSWRTRLVRSGEQRERLKKLARQSNRVEMRQATWTEPFKVKPQAAQEAIRLASDFEHLKWPQEREGVFRLRFFRDKQFLGEVAVKPLCSGGFYSSSGCHGALTGAVVDGYELQNGSGQALIHLLAEQNGDA